MGFPLLSTSRISTKPPHRGQVEGVGEGVVVIAGPYFFAFGFSALVWSFFRTIALVLGFSTLASAFFVASAFFILAATSGEGAPPASMWCA